MRRYAILRFVFVFPFLTPLPVYSQTQWSSPSYIDSSGHGHMALDDSGNIYTAYSRSRPGGSNIFVARSSDRGNTWTKFAFPKAEAYGGPTDIVVDHWGYVWVQWISEDSGDFTPVYLNL